MRPEHEIENRLNESNDLLAAYRQLSADMAVLFARKRIQEARVGGQTVGHETYRLIFTGSELGNIWRQMRELEDDIINLIKARIALKDAVDLCSNGCLPNEARLEEWANIVRS